MNLKLRKNTSGFTLVEVIVVLVVLTILTAILIPTFVRYIDKANNKSLIIECRQAVVASQTIETENYTNGETFSEEDKSKAKDLSEVSGTITSVTAENGKIMNLVYTKGDKKVIYCAEPDTCADHDEKYTVLDADSTDSDTDTDTDTDTDVPIKENTDTAFYIADTDYKVASLGDIESLTIPQGGIQVSKGDIYTYKGKYYIFKNGSNFQQDANQNIQRLTDTNSTAIIDYSNILTDSTGLKQGSVKKVGDSYYAFTSSDTNNNAFESQDRWTKLKNIN